MECAKKFCPFCKETMFMDNKLNNLPGEETILFSNDTLYVKVDISPVCIGHILIIPYKHYMNFNEMPNEVKEEVIKIKNKITDVYKNVYNTDVLFFEHGSAKKNYAGACIEHAHLHCIPFHFSIKKILTTKLGVPIKYNILSNNGNTNFSYLYIESKYDGKLIYKVDKLQHQFLRKVILDEFGDNNFLWQDRCINTNSIYNLNQTIMDLKNRIVI